MNGRHAGNREGGRFAVAFLVSVVLHLALVALAFLGQHLSGAAPPDPRIIDVSLVTLPGPGSPEPEEPAGPEAPVIEPEPVETVSPPEPVKKKPPKKVAEKPRKNVAGEKKKKEPIDNRLKELREKVGQEPRDDLRRALARLQEKVKQGPPSDLYKRTGPGAGTYGAPMTPYEEYLVRIAGIIQRNWSFTPRLIRAGTVVEAYVALTIQPGGSVSNVTFDRKSVSEYFNDTVLKAIEKSSPLPPVPEEVRRREALRIGLVFTPQGIE